MTSLDVSAQALPSSNKTPGIVVYTSNDCHKCAALKEWLKAANRYFEERNLENVDVMTDLVMRNVVVLSAPVIEVDKTIYTEDLFFDGNSLSVNRLLGILEGQ
jgi:glutaredoxin